MRLNINMLFRDARGIFKKRRSYFISMIWDLVILRRWHTESDLETWQVNSWIDVRDLLYLWGVIGFLIFMFKRDLFLVMWAKNNASTLHLTLGPQTYMLN